MWQTRIGDMLNGYGHARMYWNVTDVRDIAETQRLIGESTTNKNGDRYNMVAPDESGLMTQLELADMIRGFCKCIEVTSLQRNRDLLIPALD